ncbi:RNA polymerase sigma factor [Sphaerisporangium sp. NPDC004334]
MPPLESKWETQALVRAAQLGERASFAELFEQHYAGMLAVAYRILGYGPDAEDACQDAAITAFGRIGELRDLAAVRPWLHAIVRNNCRTMLSTRRPIPVGVAGVDLLAPELDDPAAYVERSAQRDWIWHGLQQLSPAARTVALLRYFTVQNSYEQIAMLCGIPVGTVRSRLSEARRQLAVVLPRVRDERHDGAATLVAERRDEATTILSAIVNGVPLGQVSGRWADDVTIWWPSGARLTGLASLFAVMRRDYDAGVLARLTGLVAGRGITVWENVFVNPPEDPDHCPPGGTFLLRENKGLVSEVRLLHAPRPACPEIGGPPDRTFARRPKS